MSASVSTVRGRPAIAVPALAIPATLFVVALVARLAAIVVVRFPLSEGSAYYVAVARNLASGRGLVVDAIWSYSTPPLVLPRPAFELWQPLASLIAAVPMQLLGTSFASAQVGFAVLGALLAPLTWYVARDAAARLDLPANRQSAVAAGAGLVAVVFGPLLLSTAVPDSTLPFTALVAGATLAMPSAACGNRRAIALLGVLLGLAYLTRMEAVYAGIVFVGVAWQARARGGRLVERVGMAALVAGAVAAPWLLRNVVVFGKPFPGQIADNVLLTRNDEIFAYTDHPTIAGFLGQGPAAIATNMVGAAWHQAVDVLLVPGAIVTLVAFVALVVGRRRAAALTGSPLLALLAYGGVAFVVTAVVFPIATLWGTFEHAAGPLFIALIVVAVLGADACVVRVRAWRAWPRPNAWMGPAALVALVVPVAALQIGLAGMQANARASQIDAAANAIRPLLAGDSANEPVLTDRPLWMSNALGRPALIVPNEPAASATTLARAFGAHYVVLVDGLADRASLLTGPAARCLSQVAFDAPPQVPDLVVYAIDGACE